MKRVVVCLAVMLVAVAAQAQSPRVEVQITNKGLGKTLITKRKKLNDTTQTALHAALERAIARQVLQAKKDTVVVDTATVQRAVARANRYQWLRAIFLGGKFPGESDEAYKKRMQIQSYPAAQPFK